MQPPPQKKKNKILFIIMRFRVVSRTELHRVLSMSMATTRVAVNRRKETTTVSKCVTEIKN